jgi:hypothetical protein
MKKRIVLAVFSLIMMAAQAQEVTVKSPSPNLKVEFKRCIANSGMAFIDILITNASKQDTKIDCRPRLGIYDDEGNVYDNYEWTPTGKYKVYIATSNTDSQPLECAGFDIPAGISYKLRIIVVDGFDKYATIVNLLKIDFNWNVFGTKSYGMWVGDTFELRNLPITWE